MNDRPKTHAPCSGVASYAFRPHGHRSGVAVLRPPLVVVDPRPADEAVGSNLLHRKRVPVMTAPTTSPDTGGEALTVETARDLPPGSALEVINADTFLIRKGFPNGSRVTLRSFDDGYVDISELPYPNGSRPFRFALATPTPRKAEGWQEFEDDLSDAIQDSIDMDWNSRDGARAVIRWLIQNAPLGYPIEAAPTAEVK